MNESTLARGLRPQSPRPRFRGRTLAALTIAGALFAGGGCATEPAAYPAADTTKYTLENTDRFVVLDRSPVSCTGLQHHALADGRLEVVANLKNRDNSRITFQASCVFHDEQGLNVVEETAWKSVTVAENATEAVRFTASSPAAKKYTIRVRQAR